MTKLQKLRFSSLILLGFFIASVAFHYWQFAYEGRGYPESTYLYRPSDVDLVPATGMPFVSQVSKLHCFGDFFLTWAQNIERDPYRPTSPVCSNYFPFAHAVTLPFSLSSYPLSITMFLLLVVGSSLAFSWYYFRDRRTDRWENAKFVLIFALLNYPMQMVADRGNIDILVFLFVWGGLANFQRRSYWSAFFLACATAMKGFPGLLLALFLPARRYRPFVFALCCCSVLTAASLCVLKGGFWVNGKLLMQAASRYTSIVNSDASRNVQHTSGWFGMVEGLAFWYPTLFDSGPLHWIRQNYTAMRGLLLFCFVLPVIGMRRLELWQVAAPMTFAMVVILPAAYDYRLILALVPFALFINSNKRRGSDVWYVLLFSLLMVPKQFAILQADVGIGTVLNPPIMLAITAMVVYDLVAKARQPLGVDASAVLAGAVQSGTARALGFESNVNVESEPQQGDRMQSASVGSTSAQANQRRFWSVAAGRNPIGKALRSLAHFLWIPNQLAFARSTQFDPDKPGWSEFECARTALTGADELRPTGFYPPEALRLYAAAARLAVSAHLARDGVKSEVSEPDTAQWNGFTKLAAGARLLKKMQPEQVRTVTACFESEGAHRIAQSSWLQRRRAIAVIRKFTRAAIAPLAKESAAVRRVLVQRWVRVGVPALLLSGAIFIGLRPKTPRQNLALRRPVTAVELDAQYVPDPGALVDGNRENLGVHASGSPAPHAIIDLGVVTRVSRVVVYNRTDCCKDRAVPLAIDLSQDLETFHQVGVRDTIFDRWELNFPLSDTRYVRISLMKEGVLNLSEVEVY